MQNGPTASEIVLRAEIERLHVVIRALMDRAERSGGAEVSGYSIFQTAVVLEEQVRRRTQELEQAMRDVEHANRALRESERQIRRLAFHDPLTQVPNRRLLVDRLAQALAACRRSGLHGALLYIDLDDFKPLNDRHGHEVGDLLLVEAAQRMSRSVRESDTVARMGGDEFVVMVTDLPACADTAAARAAAVAAKLLTLLAEPYTLHAPGAPAGAAPIHHRSTASLGVALFDGRDGDQDEVIRRADQAMYRAKAQRHDQGGRATRPPPRRRSGSGPGGACHR